jgi:protein involved in polysaccharide export with SLBB domain
VIGPQDNLSIIVSDETELTGKYRVDTDGTISMPYLSRVPLAGLSLAEAQDKITTMLKAGFIRNRRCASRSISSRRAACS